MNPENVRHCRWRPCALRWRPSPGNTQPCVVLERGPRAEFAQNLCVQWRDSGRKQYTIRAIMNARRCRATPFLWWNLRTRNRRVASGCVSHEEPSFVSNSSAAISDGRNDVPHASHRGDFEQALPIERRLHGGGSRRGGRGARHGKQHVQVSSDGPQNLPHVPVLTAAIWLLRLVLLSGTIVPATCQNTVVDAPAIMSLVADDPDDLDGTIITRVSISESCSRCLSRCVTSENCGAGVYANLDTITITFDKDTDKAGLAQGVVQTRGTVDALFSFDQALGSSYRGIWKTKSVFEITILDWPGSAPPRVGPEGGSYCECIFLPPRFLTGGGSDAVFSMSNAGLIVTPRTSAGR